MKPNLKTNYLGMQLKSPFVLGASPVSENLDQVLELEDAGASALVLHSLFEEQIVLDAAATVDRVEWASDSYAEALSYFPKLEEYSAGADEYLERISRIKSRVNLPVIGSLNGRTDGGWVRYAKLIEEAGADALELNIYDLPTDPETGAAEIEQRLCEFVRAVRDSISIPLAVKLGPFYTSLPNLVQRLELQGINGVVLFNRFYQPDLNIEELTVEPRLYLSTSNDLLLRIRWLAILHGRCRVSLALSGGVHHVQDAIKGLMAGADVLQIVSLILRHGVSAFASLVSGVEAWMSEHEYSSVQEMRGSLSHKHSPDPSELERANYLRILQLWRK